MEININSGYTQFASGSSAAIGEEMALKQNNGIELTDDIAVTQLSSENVTEPLESKASQSNILLEALNAAGLKPTEQNLNMVSILLKSNFPINKETLSQFALALKIFGSENVEKSLFFIGNEMRVGLKAAETLNKFTQGEIRISEQLIELIDNVMAFPNGNIKAHFIDILLNAGETPIQDSMSVMRRSVADAEGSSISAQISAGDILSDSTDNSDQGKAFAIPESSNYESDIVGGATAAISGHSDVAANDKPLADRSKIMMRAPQEVETNPTLDISSDTIGQFADTSSNASDNTTMEKRGFGRTNESLARLFPDKPEMIHTVMDAMEAIKNGTPLKTEANTIIKDTLIRKLFANPQRFSTGEAQQIFQSLKTDLAQIRELLAENLHEQSAARLLENIRDLNDNIDFASHIKQNIFMQIPLQINDRQTTGELFIFRGKACKKTKASGISALIALDTAFLGRFETYIVKNGRSVSCQFRLGNTEAENLVRNSLTLLQEKLDAYEYTLTSFTFKSLDESFTLLHKEPLDETDGDETEITLRTVMFDRRT